MWFSRHRKFKIQFIALNLFYFRLLLLEGRGPRCQAQCQGINRKVSFTAVSSVFSWADQMPSWSVIFLTRRQAQLRMLQTKATRRKGRAGHVQSLQFWIFWCLFQNCFLGRFICYVAPLAPWAGGLVEPLKAKLETRCQEGGGQNKHSS